MSARLQDILLGSVFAAMGLAAAIMAAGYRGASGLYPGVLGYVLAGLGVILIIRSVWNGRAEAREIIESLPKAAITVTIAAAYLALVPLLGFYLASALLVLIMPVALGFRRHRFALITTLIFIAIVWLVFSLILKKPLPVPYWLAL